MEKPRSVILLSAGLDSTVNAYVAAKESECVLALTFDYGQRAAKKEIERAARTAGKLKIPHKVIELPWFRDFTKTSLVSSITEVPRNMVLDDETATRETAKAVWVPNRNGIFLSIGAAFAEGLGASWLIPGFNKEEAATFPDNSLEYMRSVTGSLFYSTANKVEVKCFTVSMEKPEIARLGRSLGVDFSDVWPCYLGGETLCGQCESCLRFQRALGQAN